MTLTETAYDIAGPEDGPPVVLIHGLGLSRAIWAGLMPALAAEHRVLSYDFPGHGQSGPATRKMSLERYAEQVRGLMDAAGMESATVIGFSLGGMINRKLATMA
ncbi:MAG: alpha/beta fold hydrolase, partial [Roseovarius indicus]